MPSFSLQDRVAIVTGASSGLGAAIADGLHEQGALVYGFVRNVEACEGMAWAQSSHRIRECDVTNRESIAEAVEFVVSRHSRIDILVNSAGRGGRHEALSYPEELWRSVMDVNLTGSFAMCQAVAKHMPAGGSIVNVASVGGMAGYAGSVGYQASKGGVVQMTRSLAIEWAPLNIRVNAVAPAQFATKMVLEQWEREPELADFFRSRTPLKGIGAIEDIVGPVVFLASSAASMVTGHVLSVDGGYLAQ